MVISANESGVYSIRSCNVAATRRIIDKTLDRDSVLAFNRSGGRRSTPHIQEDAAKAVAIIQKSQKSWYAQVSCVSCHQQVFPTLAFRSGREHGIPVDEQAAHADAVAAFRFYSNFERAVEYTYVIDPALNDGYSLIAANAAGVRPTLVTALYPRLLAARQEPNGHWETGDVRPPQSYSRTSDAYSTSQVLVALHEAGGVTVQDDAWQSGINYLC